jgi:hypothetical protein
MPELTASASVMPILPHLDDPVPMTDDPVTLEILVHVRRPEDGQAVDWVRVGGLPPGASLSAGVPVPGIMNAGEEWFIDAAALAPFLQPDGYGGVIAVLDLVMTPPAGFSGYFDVAVLARIVEPGVPDAYASGMTVAPAVHISATAYRLQGGAAGDSFQGLDGADTIDCGAGDDRVWAGLGGDIVDGGDGDDRIWGGGGDERLQGGAGDDQLHDEEGNSTLEGGDGNDLLMCGAGSDVATGGAGADHFSFFPTFELSFGHDVITDFDPLEDRLYVHYDRSWTPADYAAVTRQVGADVVIAFDADTSLTILNALVSEILTQQNGFG